MPHNASKIVIVTGASRGLGLGIAEGLLCDGYCVAACSRSVTPALHDLQLRHNDSFFWRECDIGDEPAQERFMDSVLEWSSGRSLFGLINNAGIAGEGILATYPVVNTETIIRVNLLGAIQMARLFLRQLLRARGGLGGRIINISSIIGSRGYTGLSVYAATKAGMDGLTRSLAREVGPRSVTVNSVAPGYLETDMSASLRPEQRQQIVRRTPLGRLGSIADIVPVVRFLLSDSAAFVTGQTLVVDGGITC